MNVSGVVANANVTVDQNSAEGEVLFNITAFDLAGNNFTADQTQLNSSNVTIDTSSPILENLTIYTHHVCRVQDCNVCSFEGLIYGDCDA